MIQCPPETGYGDSNDRKGVFSGGIPGQVIPSHMPGYASRTRRFVEQLFTKYRERALPLQRGFREMKNLQIGVNTL
jgi:hypothetical protein